MADQKDDFKKIIEKVKIDAKKNEEQRLSLEVQKQSSSAKLGSENYNLKLNQGRDPQVAAKSILQLHKLDQLKVKI